jgi:hypothetical protein
MKGTLSTSYAKPLSIYLDAAPIAPLSPLRTGRGDVPASRTSSPPDKGTLACRQTRLGHKRALLHPSFV